MRFAVPGDISFFCFSMLNEEKRSIISIISVSVVYIIYCIYVFGKFTRGSLDLVLHDKTWGLIILAFIPVQIVLNIIISILYSIVHAVITREEDDSEMVDERDKVIRLKANSVAYMVVSVGFMLSVITVAMGLPLFIMLNVLYLAFNLAEIIGSSIQLRYYSRGF